MGNSLACFSIDTKKLITGRNTTSRLALPGPPGKLTGLFQRTFSKKKKEKNQNSSVEADVDDDSLIREQAMAAVMLLKQYQRNGSVPFSRSSSVAYQSQSQSGKDKQALRRSSTTTTRQRLANDSDPLPPKKLVINQVCVHCYVFVVFLGIG